MIVDCQNWIVRQILFIPFMHQVEVGDCHTKRIEGDFMTGFHLVLIDIFNHFKHIDSRSAWYSLSVAGGMVGNALYLACSSSICFHTITWFMPSPLNNHVSFLSPALRVWRKKMVQTSWDTDILSVLLLVPICPLFLAICLPLSFFPVLSFLPSENCCPTPQLWNQSVLWNIRGNAWWDPARPSCLNLSTRSTSKIFASLH